MISIVIPSYNQAKYLPEAIDSILAQTIYPSEIIIVDDGSTDQSVEVVEEYQKKPHLWKTWCPLKLIQQVNKGLSSARNTGIMNTLADYVLFLDADDILMPNCIEEITKVIKDTHADVISPSFKTFGTSNQEVILMPNPKLEDFLVGNRVGYCSAVKRDALLEVGGYSPRMFAGYEDLHLWFNLLTKGKTFVTIPEVLWKYRTKEKSMWHDAIKHHEELMAQIHKDFPQVTNIINDPLPN